MTKRAVIVGCDGQDGRLLAALLKARGYRLALAGRKALSVDGRKPRRFSIADARGIERLVAGFKPHEIYYLAAFHHSAQDTMPDLLELFRRSWEVHVLGLLNFLEAVRRRSPETRLFYASSSRVFGSRGSGLKNESSPLEPQDFYATTKIAGMHLCRLYRNQHGVFASVGILFNHESPLREAKYVSQRIVRGLIEVKRGARESLVLGDLSARVDWGYAPDYVEAMTRVLAHRKPEDFVVATGRTHSVAEFAAEAAARLGLDWRRCVKQQAGLLHRSSGGFAGDPSKLRRATGWRPKLSFREMVGALVAAYV